MNHPDLPLSREWTHELEQATGAFRQAAEYLAAFKTVLIEEGFSEEGAERLTDTFMGVAFNE